MFIIVTLYHKPLVKSALTNLVLLQLQKPYKCSELLKDVSFTSQHIIKLSYGSNKVMIVWIFPNVVFQWTFISHFGISQNHFANFTRGLWYRVTIELDISLITRKKISEVIGKILFLHWGLKWINRSVNLPTLYTVTIFLTPDEEHCILTEFLVF